jgi:two-component system NarL family sensor kinase
LVSDPSYQAITVFAIGTAVMLFMAAAIILFVVFYQKRMLHEQLRRQSLEADYQRDLLSAQMESQENERKRVAKDLHDDVGLMLQALRATTLAVLKEAPEQDRQEVQQMVTEVTETVRRICWDLMPSSLEYFGLTEAVDEMCNRLTSRGQIPVKFSHLGKNSLIEKNKQTLLYRMTQELVSNALRHAKASEVEVKFVWTEQHLQINVLDNGTGFDRASIKQPAAPGRGLGLLSLESRASLLPAQLLFETNFPVGTNASINYSLAATHGQN